MSISVSATKKNMMDMFIDGARSGFHIATHNLLPSVVMAFVLIRVLDVTGLLKIIGGICGPVMAIFGLPGEAATVLVASLMSMGGSAGMAASLFASGYLNPVDVSVLLPSMYLMGNPVQNIGRVLGVSEVNTRYYPAIIGVCIINSLLSIWCMQFLLMFFK